MRKIRRQVTRKVVEAVAPAAKRRVLATAGKHGCHHSRYFSGIGVAAATMIQANRRVTAQRI